MAYNFRSGGSQPCSRARHITVASSLSYAYGRMLRYLSCCCVSPCECVAGDDPAARFICTFDVSNCWSRGSRGYHLGCRPLGKTFLQRHVKLRIRASGISSTALRHLVFLAAVWVYGSALQLIGRPGADFC